MALHLTLRLLLVEAVPRGEGGSLMGSLGAALNQRLQHLPEAPRQGPERRELPRWRGGKEPTCQCRRCTILGCDPWVRRIPWSRKSPLQYSYLQSPRDRRAWRATMHGVSESDMTEQLSTQQKAEAGGILLPGFPICVSPPSPSKAGSAQTMLPQLTPGPGPHVQASLASELWDPVGCREHPF